MSLAKRKPHLDAEEDQKQLLPNKIARLLEIDGVNPEKSAQKKNDGKLFFGLVEGFATAGGSLSSASWVVFREDELNEKRQAIVDYCAGIDAAAGLLGDVAMISEFTAMRNEGVGTWFPTEAPVCQDDEVSTVSLSRQLGIPNFLPAVVRMAIAEGLEVQMFHCTFGAEEGSRRDLELLPQ